MAKRVTKTTLQRVKARKAAKKASVQTKQSIIEPENKEIGDVYVTDPQAEYLRVKAEADELERQIEQWNRDDEAAAKASVRRAWMVGLLVAFFIAWIAFAVMARP